jgi:hypothetical protein
MIKPIYSLTVDRDKQRAELGASTLSRAACHHNLNHLTFARTF